PAGPIAAVASRVGLDQFDVEKLEGKTAEDIRWLNQVAVRHNDIIRQAARSSPVLPLRLGTIFRSKDSLLAAVAHCRKAVADFLQALGDRQEWAVKLYVQNDRITGRLDGPHLNDAVMSGAEYLRRRGAELRRCREMQTELQREITAVEDRLAARTDRRRRVRPLPDALTGRREKMVYNAAYLLPAADVEPWLATVHETRDTMQKKGLLLEVTGPWPPYHFCPELTISASESTSK
ncbi:MAG TPA: GvpL/GvpF family gas vesicle protein, partial [Thermoguttaceae bacterium]|nr:GvpL/GvpF family gas vesicle protein [Thermoguttaceae bacterium]